MTASAWYHWDFGIWKWSDEIQVYNYDALEAGWGQYHDVFCSECGQETTVVAPVYSYGFECPWCGACYPEMQWLGPMENERNGLYWAAQAQ